LYFRINESFKIEAGRESFNFPAPKLLIDCFNYELEQIRISNTTKENIYYVNICNKFISKIKKLSRHTHKKKNRTISNDMHDDIPDDTVCVIPDDIPDNTDYDIPDDMPYDVTNSVIPFVLDNVHILDDQINLLESTNIFTCFSIAFRSWTIGDSKIFLEFYNDLMITYKYWFKFVKKIPKQYNKKHAFPVHNDYSYKYAYGHCYKFEDEPTHRRRTKKYKRYISSMCND
jgi:hypothetical protein